MPAVQLNVKLNITEELRQLETSSKNRYITYASLEETLIQKYGITLHRSKFFNPYSETLIEYFEYRLEFSTDITLAQVNYTCNHYDPVGLVGIFTNFFHAQRCIYFTKLSDMIMFKLILTPEGYLDV